MHLHALTGRLEGGDGPRKLPAVASRGCAVRKCAHSHPCTLTRFCIGPGSAWGVVHRSPAAALPVQRARKAAARQRAIARRPLPTRAAIEMALRVVESKTVLFLAQSVVSCAAIWLKPGGQGAASNEMNVRVND